MSASTTAVVTALRTRLLTFTPTVGSTLQTSLGGRLYWRAAPDDVTYPYGVLALTTLPGNDDSGLLKRGELELQLLGRPRSAQETLEGIADVAEQALWQFVQYDPAMVKCFGSARGGTVTHAAPADPELVQVVRWFPLFFRPAYLSQYAV